MSLVEVIHNGSKQHPQDVIPASKRPRIPKYVQDPNGCVKNKTAKELVSRHRTFPIFRRVPRDFYDVLEKELVHITG